MHHHAFLENRIWQPVIDFIYGGRDGDSHYSKGNPTSVDDNLNQNNPCRGFLMSLIFAVDWIGLVKLMFPNEWLLEWAHFMLDDTKDFGHVLVELYPLYTNQFVFRDRIRKFWGNCLIFPN